MNECPHCQNFIPNSVDVCPHCSNVKIDFVKIIFFTFIMAGLWVVVRCCIPVGAFQNYLLIAIVIMFIAILIFYATTLLIMKKYKAHVDHEFKDSCYCKICGKLNEHDYDSGVCKFCGKQEHIPGSSYIEDDLYQYNYSYSNDNYDENDDAYDYTNSSSTCPECGGDGMISVNGTYTTCSCGGSGVVDD